jgi:O-antigen/teichoic acid export membrane protein
LKNLIWSLVERVLPRAANALLMVLLAYFLTPFEVGLYVWPMLILTFYYSALDGAIRQVVVPSWSSKNAFGLLVSYQRWASVAGVAVMIVTIGIMLLHFTADRAQILGLLPLVAVPVFNSISVIPLGFIQKMNDWRALARMQVIAAAVSLIVSVPAVLLTRSLTGASLQVLLTECIFAFAVRRAAESRGMAEIRAGLSEGPTYGREFFHASVFFVGGWAQAQIDKVLIGAFAGTSLLGSYNFALAVARNPGDAVSASTSNVLRVRLSEMEVGEPRELGKAADGVLLKAVGLGVIMVIVLIMGVELILKPLLGATWQAPLNASLPATISILPTILSWGLPVVMLSIKRLAWGGPLRVVGILLALPIAYAATVSLSAAAWALLGREVVMSLLFMLACGRAVPVRASAMTMLLVVVLSGVIAYVGTLR